MPYMSNYQHDKEAARQEIVLHSHEQWQEWFTQFIERSAYHRVTLYIDFDVAGVKRDILVEPQKRIVRDMFPGKTFTHELRKSESKKWKSALETYKHQIMMYDHAQGNLRRFVKEAQGTLGPRFSRFFVDVENIHRDWEELRSMMNST